MVMPAMTPILEIQIIGTSVSFVDGAGNLNPIAQCNTVQDTMVTAKALAKHHRVQLWHYDARMRAAVAVQL